MTLMVFTSKRTITQLSAIHVSRTPAMYTHSLTLGAVKELPPGVHDNRNHDDVEQRCETGPTWCACQ